MPTLAKYSKQNEFYAASEAPDHMRMKFYGECWHDRSRKSMRFKNYVGFQQQQNQIKKYVRSIHRVCVRNKIVYIE